MRAMDPDCASCGACCRGLEVELVGGLDDVPDELVDMTRGYPTMRQRADGSCIALVGGACAIYATRPRECRDFQRGGGECHALRQQRGLPMLSFVSCASSWITATSTPLAGTGKARSRRA